MADDELIKASDRTCEKEGCKEPGYRWIGGDPDIKPMVLCKKHTLEFQQELMDAFPSIGA